MSDERQPGDEPEVDEETLREETQELLADARDLLAAELLLKSADPLRRDLVRPRRCLETRTSTSRQLGRIVEEPISERTTT